MTPAGSAAGNAAAPGGSIHSAAALPGREQNPAPDPAPAAWPPVGPAAVRARGSMASPLGGPGTAGGPASEPRSSTSGRCCEPKGLASSVGSSASPRLPVVPAGAAGVSADVRAPKSATSSPDSCAATQTSLRAGSPDSGRWSASGPSAAAGSSGRGSGCGCCAAPAPEQRGRKNCASRSPATCSALRPAASRSSSARPTSKPTPSAQLGMMHTETSVRAVSNRGRDHAAFLQLRTAGCAWHTELHHQTFHEQCCMCLLSACLMHTRI